MNYLALKGRGIGVTRLKRLRQPSCLFCCNFDVFFCFLTKSFIVYLSLSSWSLPPRVFISLATYSFAGFVVSFIFPQLITTQVITCSEISWVSRILAASLLTIAANKGNTALQASAAAEQWIDASSMRLRLRLVCASWRATGFFRPVVARSSGIAPRSVSKCSLAVGSGR